MQILRTFALFVFYLFLPFLFLLSRGNKNLKNPVSVFWAFGYALPPASTFTRASSRQAPAEGKAVTLRATQKTNTVINIKNIISRRLGLLVQRFRIYLLKNLRFTCAKVFYVYHRCSFRAARSVANTSQRLYWVRACSRHGTASGLYVSRKARNEGRGFYGFCLKRRGVDDKRRRWVLEYGARRPRTTIVYTYYNNAVRGRRCPRDPRWTASRGCWGWVKSRGVARALDNKVWGWSRRRAVDASGE